MELIQDSQKVILTKDLLLKAAEDYYHDKTANRFHSDALFNLRWDEKEQSVSITAVTNY